MPTFKTKLTFGSLFAGIGGFDLGFEWAGMVCKWQVEKDPFCQKVLAKHWPNVERFEDVREVGKYNLRAVDVICGGFPCQPFSEAGNKRSQEDDRFLWLEMLRIIQELHPAWVVGENVYGFVGLYLDQAIIQMENIGYEVIPLILPACAFGARHRRNRIFLIAHTRSISDKREAYITIERGADFGMDINSGEWEREPELERVVYGIPSRLDKSRNRSLGNAVIPQIAEFIATLLIRATNNN